MNVHVIKPIVVLFICTFSVISVADENQQTSNVDATRAQAVELCRARKFRELGELCREMERSSLTNSPGLYASTMKRIIHELTTATGDGLVEARKLGVTKAKDFVKREFGEKLTPEILADQFYAFSDLAGSTELLKMEETQLASERKQLVLFAMLLWDRALRLEDRYSEFNPEKLDPKWKISPYHPPASYNGTFLNGADPDHITDDHIRKEYIASRQVLGELMKGRSALRKSQDVKAKAADRIPNKLRDWYSGAVDRKEIGSVIEQAIKDRGQANRLKSVVFGELDKRREAK